MYQNHLEFVEWVKQYDTGDMNMRSYARHDAWEKQLACPILKLDGAKELEENLGKVKKVLYSEQEQGES